jgi:hypothetical protein
VAYPHCWTHLARDFRAVAERGGVDTVVGRWVLEVFSKVLAPWHRYQQGELEREAFLVEMAARQEELRGPLRWGEEHGAAATRALCRDLLARWPSLPIPGQFESPARRPRGYRQASLSRPATHSG